MMRTNSTAIITLSVSMNHWLILLMAGLIAFGLSACTSAAQSSKEAATSPQTPPAPNVTPPPAASQLTAAGFHTTTLWSLKPVMAYDALSFFNALTGDPFYLRYYQSEYDRFHRQLTPEVEAALATLEAARQKDHSIPGVDLATVFSLVNPETIDDLISLADNPEPLHQALLKSGLEGTDDIEAKWPIIQSYMPTIKTILQFLKSAGFETYWQAQVRPIEQALADRLQDKLAAYNVVPVVEALTGRPLPDNHVEIAVNYFISPHGVRLPGTRLMMETRVSDVDLWVRVTLHELLHQPYDVNDPKFWAAVDTLQADDFLMQPFKNHDVNQGYNDWPGYIAESCTDVADQFLAEQMGVARPLSQRFGPDEDGGMHVLAPALYVLARQEGFPGNGETFQAFVMRMVQEQKLAPGKLEALTQRFEALKTAH